MIGPVETLKIKDPRNEHLRALPAGKYSNASTASIRSHTRKFPVTRCNSRVLRSDINARAKSMRHGGTISSVNYALCEKGQVLTPVNAFEGARSSNEWKICRGFN